MSIETHSCCSWSIDSEKDALNNKYFLVATKLAYHLRGIIKTVLMDIYQAYSQKLIIVKLQLIVRIIYAVSVQLPLKAKAKRKSKIF